MNIRTQVAGVKLGTNINKVAVPDQLRIKRSLGIDWVNTAVGGGGMTPSTVMMLTGMPGSGKSTLMRQLADSITAAGHIAVYNSGEESIFQVKMRCEEMNLTNGFQVGQETLVTTLIDYAKKQQARHPNKQVFIIQDSLQTLNDGYYKDGGTTSNTPVRCAELLTSWAKETFGIVIFIGQVTKSGVFAGKNTLRHLIDVHCELMPDDDPKSPTHKQLVFNVSKNRFGYSGKAYVVSLNKLGISVIDDVANVRPRASDAEDEGEVNVEVELDEGEGGAEDVTAVHKVKNGFNHSKEVSS